MREREKKEGDAQSSSLRRTPSCSRRGLVSCTYCWYCVAFSTFSSARAEGGTGTAADGSAQASGGAAGRPFSSCFCGSDSMSRCEEGPKRERERGRTETLEDADGSRVVVHPARRLECLLDDWRAARREDAIRRAGMVKSARRDTVSGALMEWGECEALSGGVAETSLATARSARPTVQALRARRTGRGEVTVAPLEASPCPPSGTLHLDAHCRGRAGSASAPHGDTTSSTQAPLSHVIGPVRDTHRPGRGQGRMRSSC